MVNLSNNPMGSIFEEEPTESPDSFGGPGHDPLRGPLTSPPIWEAQQAAASGKNILEQPVTERSAPLPSTPDFMCCLDGPCQYYRQQLVDPGYAGTRRMIEVKRICVGFGTAEAMSEESCFACTRYSPPAWSLKGWRRWVIGQHRFLDIQSRLKLPIPAHAPLIEFVYNIVKGSAPELPGKNG